MSLSRAANPYPSRFHRPATQPIQVQDRESVRALLEADPVANAVVWNRVYQHPDYRELWVDALPPKAVLAVDRASGPEDVTGLVLHGTDVAAARTVLTTIPPGPIFFHLTEEWQLGLVEERAVEARPRSAWLFEMDADDFADVQAHEARPVDPQWAPMIAKLWEPEWHSEPYVRSRIERGPSAGIYVDGQLVAWSLTHFETDRVLMMGFLHVLEPHRRRGYAKSVGSALAREALRRGKIPILHVYVDNPASLELTPKLGFHRVKRQVWGDAVLR